jgi:hypothetical protein
MGFVVIGVGCRLCILDEISDTLNSRLRIPERVDVSLEVRLESVVVGLIEHHTVENTLLDTAADVLYSVFDFFFRLVDFGLLVFLPHFLLGLSVACRLPAVWDGFFFRTLVAVALLIVLVLSRTKALDVLGDDLRVARRFVFAEALAPAAERFAGEVAHGLPERVIVAKPRLEIASELLDGRSAALALAERVGVA